jgi:transposase-like protein
MRGAHDASIGGLASICGPDSAAVEKFLNRALADEDFRFVRLDGTFLGDLVLVVALGIDCQGKKRVFGLVVGTTESEVTCKLRWGATGLECVERRFRRSKGYRAMPLLIRALDATRTANSIDSAARIASNNTNHPPSAFNTQ